MNAVEIEEAISQLAMQPFDVAEFPFAFLEAFGNKATTIKRLRNTGKSSTNASDIDGGVLQRNNIHIAVCAENTAPATLEQLRTSPATSKAKAKFILATDGVTLEAEDTNSGETVACDFQDFPNHFGFFLPLAGISTVKQIRNNPIDIQATGRLNRLYVELLKDNEDWATEEGRHAMNQFMTRLIFCFFAEDTDIFRDDNLFTGTIEQMSDARSGNTDFVIGQLFRAMDIAPDDRAAADLPRWADAFPYVNGGLFTGSKAIPTFSRIARSYLLHVGKLNWKAINPDIFGSMIQAVADDEERGELGMHYTSVPNILKVLNPLFLDELREQLEQAGDNARKLLNLRRRLANIRVFDPACGSGNFLVIAYIQLREIEAEVLRRRGEANESGFVNQKSWIRLKNFYGIEIKDFAVEVARLSLLIAEFQCDVRFLGQKEATALVLPLKKTGQIRCGNALRVDWLDVCPLAEDAEVETYICGNPPYLGAKKKSKTQVEDMVLVGLGKSRLLDYVCAFIVKGLHLISQCNYSMALVSTSSICQGEQVSLLWPIIFDSAFIKFAYTPFKWANSAARNAGVYCTIIGLQKTETSSKKLISESNQKICTQISPYLVEAPPVICNPQSKPLSELSVMTMGSNPVDGKHLGMTENDARILISESPHIRPYLKRYGGTAEMVSGMHRRCVWITEENKEEAFEIESLRQIVNDCQEYRKNAGRDAKKAAKRPYAFCYSTFQEKPFIQVGNTIGNAFSYIPATLREAGFVSNHNAFTIYSTDGMELSIILSKLHMVWAEAISGRLGNGIRYGNTVVYNTFPVPTLTEKNKTDLTRCAENILLAREAHFPKTIADLYNPDNMPDNLRHAHEQNDEVLERIYIGRRFKNDTERLEKLFELYTKMTSD